MAIEKKKRILKFSLHFWVRMETGFLSIVKPPSAAANRTQWKIVTLTNRASQTGETKTLAWSAGQRNGDSLGWRLKQLLILQNVISKRWKCSSVTKMSMKTFLTNNTTHLLSPQLFLLIVRKKKNLLHSQDSQSKRSSRSEAPGESDQLRCMRGGTSVEGLVSSNVCG